MIRKRLGHLDPYTQMYQEELKKVGRESKGLSLRTISAHLKAERRFGRLKPHGGRRKPGKKK
jgi:hypothetical protein